MIKNSIFYCGALLAAGVIGYTMMFPSVSAAACSCGGGDGVPLIFSPTAPILIDGDVTEWGTVHNDEDNNVCDGPSGVIADRDTPGNGMDIVQFSFTYDDSSLYFYTERVGSANNPQTFLYYADTNLDGYMDNTETVIVAEWKGNNRHVDVFLATYNPTYAYAATGDPMTDPATGFGDGWTLPGNLTNITGPIASGTFGSTDGLAMELAVPWSALGFTVPAGHQLHVSSTNANKNANNLGSQIDDNLGGCGGGAGTTQFADLDFTGENSLSGFPGDTVQGLHHLVNLGNGSDSFSFAYTVTGTWSPTVSLYLDNGDNILGTGDTPITSPIQLASGGSVEIIIVYGIGSTAFGPATVTTTATSQFSLTQLITVSDSAVDTVSLAAPDLVVIKSVAGVTDSRAFNSSNPKAIPGASVTYLIQVSNVGSGSTEADSVVITDRIPPGSEMFVGDGSASPFTWSGTGSGLTYTFGGLGDTGDDITFTSENGPSPAYTYSPSGGVDGYDSAVTGFRVNPKGAFNPSSDISLTLPVRVR